MNAGAAASGSALGPHRAIAPQQQQQRIGAAPPTVQEQQNKFAILVHPRQTGNDVLKYIRNVPYRFEPGAANCSADYVIGSTVVIFVTIKWHLTHASYTEKRLAGVTRAGSGSEAGSKTKLRVLLVKRDVEASADTALRTLAVLCVAREWSLIVASSDCEAARYIEGFRVFEHSSASALQARPEVGFAAQAVDALTSVRFVNKTDAATLLGHCGSLAKVFAASTAELAAPPGIGEKKSRRLADAFNLPFMPVAATARAKQTVLPPPASASRGVTVLVPIAPTDAAASSIAVTASSSAIVTAAGAEESTIGVSAEDNNEEIEIISISDGDSDVKDDEEDI